MPGYNARVDRRTINRAAELLFVALVGGAIALGGAAALGRLGKETTVEQMTARQAKDHGWGLCSECA